MTNILEQSKELRKIWSGFQGARALITANNYRVFDYLEEQKTAKGLARELKTDTRATEILLDALTGLGLLKKRSGKYENSELASRFLVSRKPYYQGDIIRHVETLWQNWCRCYSPNEMKGWLLKAGFKSVKKKPVADGVLIIAGK
ncbi:MAG: hypothetical protein HZA14_09130 [Nitrospirae bacterium]|nr:hypothetical protein [Nitrospirota bacterium]